MKTNSPETNRKIWLVAATSFALMLLTASSQTALAQQWTTNGNDISNTNSGKVGIGTTSPGQKLEIAGGLRIGGAATLPAALPAGVFSYDHPVLHEFIGDGTGYSRTFSKRASNTTTDLVTLLDTGNVGIGTIAPSALLHVNGNSGIITTGAGGILAFQMRDGSTVGGLYGMGNVMRLWRADAGDVIGITSSGNVGIGTTTPGANYKLDVAGNINSNATITGNNIVAKYQDVAEWVESSETLPAGTVVVLDITKSNQVVASSTGYDTRVAGVISAQPGIALGESGAGKVLVATTGRVRVKVDATHGPIHIGDLLVSSDMPGVAMKSEPVNLSGIQLHRPGTLIGKALEPLEKGKGEILVLLSLQ